MPFLAELMRLALELKNNNFRAFRAFRAVREPN
jgi:hypothetical protein